MTNGVKIGVLGGGGILSAHQTGYRVLGERGAVVAVAEPNPARREAIFKVLGREVPLFEDYRDLLERAEVDAVDILLPHHLHLPATEAAARAGKHVLVEKVMARNSWECDRMIEACERAGVTLTVCHDRRYDGQWRALKTLVERGALGEVAFWKLDHNQDVAPLARGLAWAADWNKLGGGAIMSCLTHQIDALRWYAGEIAEVACMTQVLEQRMQGETIGVILCRTKSGALAQLAINWMTRSSRGPNALWYEMVQACGTAGEAYFQGKGVFLLRHDGSYEAFQDLLEGPVPEESRTGKGFVRVKAEPQGGHAGCILEWVKRLRGEPHGVVTDGREVRGTVEAAEAAYRAAASGRHVTLPIEALPWTDRK